MFYCDLCAEQKSWPRSWFNSYGNCEVCGQPRVCNEVPSSELPPATEKESPTDG